MSSSLMKLIHRKKNLFRVAKRSMTDIAWEKYKSIRNEVSTKIRAAKTHFLESFSLSISDHHKFWSLAKKISKDSHPIPSAISYKTMSASSPMAQANLFNKFFASCFTSIRPTLTYLIPTGNSLSTILCSQSEVHDLLLSLKENKASGPDGISATMLRNTATSIAPALTSLFNQSLSTGIFPKCWKVSNIVPVHKKNSRSSVENYRPISLLSIVSKVLERIVYNRIMKHLVTNDILKNGQYGFRPRRSTQDALLSATGDWHSLLDGGNSISTIFFDLAKAFDTVPHEGLISALESIGITGTLLHWIKSYLKDRSQQVVIRGHISDPIPVHSGVPQGSILGPLFFIIYMNSIFSVCLSKSAKLILYADDIMLYKVTNTQLDISELQSDVNKIACWVQSVGLKISHEKTKFMLITRKQSPPVVRISLNNCPIDQVSAYKYLGVTISSTLQWKDHIHHVTSKARQRLGFMYRNLKSLSISAKIHLYKSCIIPLLDYCCCVWDPYHQKYIEELQSVQAFAFKIIANNWSYSTSDLASLPYLVSIPPLASRRSYFKLLSVGKILSGQSPMPQSTFSFQSPSATRSSKDYKLQKPFVSTLSHQSSFLVSSITLWNELPAEIASAYTSKNFKYLLKSYIFNS